MEGFDKVFKARCKALLMLRARNYSISEELLKEDYTTFQDRLLIENSRRSLKGVYNHNSMPDNRILINFPDEENLNVPLVANFTQMIKDLGAKRGIIVTRGLATGMAKSAIEEIAEEGGDHRIIIEHFEEEQLSELRDFTRELRIEVLSDKEREAFKKRFNIDEEDLPKIDINEPEARFYGVSKGDLVKLVRAETGGDYITFRLAK